MESASISVIIPAFNAEGVLRRAVLSVLAQTRPVQEILIYDDASKDGTRKLANDLELEFPEVRVLFSDQNAGVGHARTVLLQAAKGDYFAFLDADDIWHPEKTKIQMDALERANAQICTSAYEIVDDAGKRLGVRTPPNRITFKTMHFSNWIPTSAAIVAASLVDAREMPKGRRREDYGYWLNLFRKNPNLRVASTKDIVTAYSRSDSSMSSNKFRNLKWNFLLFRDYMGYGTALAAILTSINTIVRLFRA